MAAIFTPTIIRILKLFFTFVITSILSNILIKSDTIDSAVPKLIVSLIYLGCIIGAFSMLYVFIWMV